MPAFARSVIAVYDPDLLEYLTEHVAPHFESGIAQMHTFDTNMHPSRDLKEPHRLEKLAEDAALLVVGIGEKNFENEVLAIKNARTPFGLIVWNRSRYTWTLLSMMRMQPAFVFAIGGPWSEKPETELRALFDGRCPTYYVTNVRKAGSSIAATIAEQVRNLT